MRQDHTYHTLLEKVKKKIKFLKFKQADRSSDPAFLFDKILIQQNSRSTKSLYKIILYVFIF
jgi:hypothetical protein